MADPVSTPTTFDEEFDVVVVGGGGSGATAAITAHEEGAHVLVLEKSASLGGSTQESGGSLRLVTDPAGTLEHYWHLTQHTTPREVIAAFVNVLVELPQWVRAHGGELADYDPVADSVFPARRPGTAFPDVPYSSSLGPRARMKPTVNGRVRGAALWDFLERNLAQLGIETRTRSRVLRLVTDPADRSVVGLEYSGPDGPRTVRARRGVVLCSGGYNYDPELQKQYLGLSLPALSPPGRNAGDGIRMAQDAGADLWHMTAAAATVGYKFPEYDAGFWCQMPDFGFAMVDQRARRYICETEIENHAAMLALMAQDARSGAYLRAPSFMVFDETTRLAGRLATLKTGENRHFPWSEDNSAEIARGWILTAPTLGELATKLGVPAGALLATIADFNRCAVKESRDVFDRPAEHMRPIADPPFYGVRVHPTLVNTQGGPRRNERGAILRPDGSELAGLFGAGELGSIWNRLYPGAGNVCECLVFGQISGRSAAQAPSR